jgi:hypothetical protein
MRIRIEPEQIHGREQRDRDRIGSGESLPGALAIQRYKHFWRYEYRRDAREAGEKTSEMVHGLTEIA